MRKPLNPESRDPLKSFVRTSLSRFLLVPVVPKEAGGDECVLPRGVIEVDVERVFDNCPRYIHRLELVEYSRYVPEPDREPPVPEWKLDPAYRDVLPDRDLTPGEIAARDAARTID